MIIDQKLVNYPFLAEAREQLAKVPLEESSLPHKAIVDHARYRLLRAVQNPDLEIQRVHNAPRYMSYSERTNDTAPEDVVEFYSFFVAVLAAAREPFLRTALARAEAQRAKAIFVKEQSQAKLSIISESIGLPLKASTERRGRYLFECPVEHYLSVAAKYDLAAEEEWKLVNLPLDNGKVYFDLNMIQDLFTSLSNMLMVSGMKSIRSQPVPDFVKSLVLEIQPYIPAAAPRQMAGYSYVERLLQHPITDGRHRTTWLILAPYFVNVKGLSEDAAFEMISNYISMTSMRQFIRYQVKRAARNGLLPLSEQTLRTKHRDLFSLLPKEAFVK